MWFCCCWGGSRWCSMLSNAPVGAAPPYAYQKFERQQQRSTNISKSRWSWFWCLARCDYSSTNLSHEPCNCWFWSIATRPRGVGLGNRGSFGGLRTARAKYFPCAGGKYVSEIIHRLWGFFFVNQVFLCLFKNPPDVGWWIQQYQTILCHLWRKKVSEPKTTTTTTSTALRLLS